jgi:hypothetical protein
LYCAQLEPQIHLTDAALSGAGAWITPKLFLVVRCVYHGKLVERGNVGGRLVLCLLLDGTVVLIFEAGSHSQQHFDSHLLNLCSVNLR